VLLAGASGFRNFTSYGWSVFSPQASAAICPAWCAPPWRRCWGLGRWLALNSC